MRLRSSFGVAALLLAAAALLPAHETWLQPESFHARAGQEIALDLSSGMAFPALESAIAPERVAKAACRIGERVTELARGVAGEKSLRLRMPLDREGLATVWVDLAPKEIELSDDKVEEYFVDIAATGEVRAAWSKLRGKVAWRESYVKHAKSFVQVGAATGDASWSKPVGAVLELVPLADPRAATAGRPLIVRLDQDGKPCARQPVGLVVEGDDAPSFATTDADGKATFSPARAGRALLYTTMLRLAPDGATWSSDFATLTFAIAPKE